MLVSVYIKLAALYPPLHLCYELTVLEYTVTELFSCLLYTLESQIVTVKSGTSA